MSTHTGSPKPSGTIVTQAQTFLPTLRPSLHPVNTLPPVKQYIEEELDPTSQTTSSFTVIPTSTPTANPTGIPTSHPTSTPTGIPTGTPTGIPTVKVTGTPTGKPTDQPIVQVSQLTQVLQLVKLHQLV